MRWILSILLVFVAPTVLSFVSFGELPRDKAARSERIRQSGEVRIGPAESAPDVIKTGSEPMAVAVDDLRRSGEASRAKPAEGAQAAAVKHKEAP